MRDRQALVMLPCCKSTCLVPKLHALLAWFSDVALRHTAVCVRAASAHPAHSPACGVQALAEVCAVCNDARIEAHGGVFRAAGAPTEAALVVRAACKPVSEPTPTWL